ncbi:MAG: hypothetical protein AAB489_03285 [Patescibacteria group bacterium]
MPIFGTFLRMQEHAIPSRRDVLFLGGILFGALTLVYGASLQN